MGENQLEQRVDPSSAAWVAPRLTGKSGTVAGSVPSGYPAYARICHPAVDREGRRVSWAEVAGATGRCVHPLMQWHALVGSPDYLNMRGSMWSGEDPDRGNLMPEVLRRLCDLLGEHTADAGTCFFCLWDGWGWPDDAGFSLASGLRSPLSRDARHLVRLPYDRSYLLFTGPLPGALQIGWPWVLDSLRTQSPNLFWPNDRAWCVASEIDFDSTLVGGTTELVDAVLGNPALDAWPVGPNDSLAYDADEINTFQ
jgi:hypothetical protein